MSSIQFQSFMQEKMRTSILVLLHLSSFLLSLCNANSTSDATHLGKFIKSQVSLNSLRDIRWDRLNSKKASPQATAIYLGQQDGLMEGDKNLDQYAGYVTVDPAAGRALFYPQNSSTNPLVLWLNGRNQTNKIPTLLHTLVFHTAGHSPTARKYIITLGSSRTIWKFAGPGCSSLGRGAMVELGPFRVNSDGKTLYANEYAWNQVANVIFLESPAGVGFSYSNMTSEYKQIGNTRTADDTYTFLINWLERFPQYKTRDFYITGESYTGHYVPELAATILANNKKTKQTVINLRGLATTVDYYWTHALISDETYETIQLKCNFSNQNYDRDCANALTSASKEHGSIDQHGIYAPLCQGPSKVTRLTSSVEEADPCSLNYAETYLNHPEVQKALHVNVTGLKYPWSACSMLVGGSQWTDAPTTMLPIMQQLIESGIRVWMYSGDQDAVCPVTSTRYFINMLSPPVKSPWRPWYFENEVVGYVIGYKGLTFVTVRGAGHMVPTYQPERALTMITSFLQGNLPPAT